MAWGRASRDVAAPLLVLLLSAVWVSLTWEGAEGAAAEHLVTNLPGAPPGIRYEQYAGYIKLDDAAEKALFYWFFTADSADASSKPLAIWLNGGPGCSSVGNGLLAELGPFYPAGTSDKIYLSPNKYTWIKEANIIFLEMPVAVGFSYSNSSADYINYNDNQTAVDNLKFLLKWFQKFPEYKKNDFYLIGESYAGHYIPTFAREIVAHNDKHGEDGSRVNLVGYAIGNSYTDYYSNQVGSVEWSHSHDLMSDETYQAILKYCDWANYTVIDAVVDPACTNAITEASVDSSYLDPYNIYTPNCDVKVSSSNRASNTSSGNNTFTTPFLQTFREAASAAIKAETSSDDPCAPDLVTAYLNMPDVQSALHVNRDVFWSSCSDLVLLDYYTNPTGLATYLESMLPIHKELISRGLRAWLYSGDSDSVVPTTDTRYAIRALNYTITTPWYAWREGTQVGGFSQIYDGLTFATVRDAGHMVPLDQPGRALSLFKHFLAGTPLPGFGS